MASWYVAGRPEGAVALVGGARLPDLLDVQGPCMTRCRICSAEFDKARPMQAVCGLACALVMGQRKAELQKAKAERAERIATREARLTLKAHRDWLLDAQIAINRFVRIRDAHLPCVSCGRMHQGQWHAGHYLSVGAHPELRFEPLNIQKQCAPCNTYRAGNVAAYRVGLIERIGIERVEWLEGKHEARKYSIDELKALKAEYTRKARELERKRDGS